VGNIDLTAGGADAATDAGDMRLSWSTGGADPGAARVGNNHSRAGWHKAIYVSTDAPPAGSAAATDAAAARPKYYPIGVQHGVAKQMVTDGDWELCYRYAMRAAPLQTGPWAVQARHSSHHLVCAHLPVTANPSEKRYT